MIIARDMKPDRQIYHLGGLLIQVLKNEHDNTIEPLRAFELMNRCGSISMNAFILTLDWLYILGIVDHAKGKIVKCF